MGNTMRELHRIVAMPWKQTDTLMQRELFIQDWLSRRFPMRWLCQRYGIAPKTGYKWPNRFTSQEMTGLVNQPSVRRSQSHHTIRERGMVLVAAGIQSC